MPAVSTKPKTKTKAKPKEMATASPELPEKRKHKVFTIIDIGGKSFKFALCEEQKDKVNITSLRVEDADASRPEDLANAVSETISEMSSEKGEVIVAFSPHYMKSVIETETFERKLPGVQISSNEGRQIEEKIQKKLEKEMRVEAAGMMDASSVDLQNIEIRAITRKIDGYEVAGLKGFRGKTVEETCIGTFLATSQYSILGGLAKTHKKENSVIRDLSHAVEIFARKLGQDGVYIDIGSHTTQILAIKEKKIVFIADLEAGGDLFTQVLEKSLGMGRGTAGEFKEKYSKKELSAELQGKVRALLLPEAEKFQAILQKGLMLADSLLSSNIYIFGGGSKLPEIKEIIETLDIRELPFIKELAVDYLSPRDVGLFRDAPAAHDPYYTSLFLLAYAKIHEK